MLLGWRNNTEEVKRQILHDLQTGTVSGGPYHIELDWTDRCNIDCFFCNNRQRNRANQELSCGAVDRVLAEGRANGLHSVRLSGGGEPLFHRDITRQLELLKDHAIAIENLTTNGICLTPSMAEKLVDVGVQEVILSMNYADEDSYARGMATSTSNFDRALRAIDNLRLAASQVGAPAPEVIVVFSLYESTKDDIDGMYELGCSLEPDTIAFRDLSGIPANQCLQPEDVPRILNCFSEIIEKEALTDRLEFRFSNPVIQNYCDQRLRGTRWQTNPAPQETPSNHRFCLVPWYSLSIRGNGDVFPCCNLLLDAPFSPLGNVNRMSLSDIWNGGAFQAFRKEMEKVSLLDGSTNHNPLDFQVLHPVCATPHACHLAEHLCDEEFHAQTERIRGAKRGYRPDPLARIGSRGRESTQVPKEEMARERILVCAQFFHEDKLGGYRRLANFLEANSDWEFMLPSHRMDGKWSTQAFPWNTVEPVPMTLAWAVRGLFSAWLSSSLTYWRCLRNKESPINAVYIVAPPAWWSLPAACIARLVRLPCILDLGDPSEAVELGRCRFLKLTAEKILKRLCSQVIVASPDIASDIDDVVVTGIGEAFFRVGEQRIGSPIPKHKSPNRVIYSGSIAQPQGLVEFLEQWACFGSSDAKFELCVVGRGPSEHEESTLESLTKRRTLDGRLKFKKWIPPDEIPAQLQKADWGLVILQDDSSLEYCVPTKMLEYMAAGLPILGVGGERVRKILAESGAGVWIPRSAASARDAIHLFESTLALDGTTFGKKGHEYAKTHLRQREYQRAIGRILSKLTFALKPTAHAMKWLERHTFVYFRGRKRRSIGVRHTPKTLFSREEANWVYPEITAYAASLYAECFARSGDSSFLQTARSMGHWLCSIQCPNGSLPFAHDLKSGQTRGPNYSFDTGMAIRAWLTLDRLDRNEEWQESAHRAGLWLVDRMQTEEGSFLAAEGFDAQRDLTPDWPYGDHGVLHIKLLLPLLDLAQRFPRVSSFNKAYERLLQWGLEVQQCDGAFPIGRDWDTVFTHTHLYALEGLTTSAKGSSALERGLDWTLRHLIDSSRVPEYVSPDDIGPAALDSTAQLLRLLTFFFDTDRSEEYRRAASKIAGDLLAHQTRSGGFTGYSRKRFRSSPRTWSVLFAISALVHWEDGALGETWLF